MNNDWLCHDYSDEEIDRKIDDLLNNQESYDALISNIFGSCPDGAKGEATSSGTHVTIEKLETVNKWYTLYQLKKINICELIARTGLWLIE